MQFRPVSLMFRSVALSLVATMCSAQMPVAVTAVAPQSAPVAPSGSVTVPQGTQIPLTLVSSIRSKTTKPGDAVRAMVAFPVTVGTQLAIPAGTYVEGVVGSVNPVGKRGQPPSVQLHFTRLLYANGYAAPLNATNTQAFLIEPEPGVSVQSSDVLADARDGAPNLSGGFAGTGQTTPGLPPLPREGPNPAVIGAAVGGSFAALVILIVAMAHHRAASVDYVLFESGWQFQMMLDQPLTVDIARVNAAAQAPAN
jgi:hypothetical protein